MVSREVPYSAQTYDSPNPIARFAHRTRYRVSLATASRLLPEGGSMVDFGAGDGTFLHRFGAERPDARLVAIEPYMTIRHPGIAQVADLGEVEPASVDLIGTFEVLEHVTDAELAGFLANARRALKPGGLLLVTVPIMYGAMLPVKELSRMVLYRRLKEKTDIYRDLLGLRQDEVCAAIRSLEIEARNLLNTGTTSEVSFAKPMAGEVSLCQAAPSYAAA